MSYEGYTTFLCANGHEWTVDALDLTMGEGDTICPHCSARKAFYRDTDETNGFEKRNPRTHAPKLLEDGFDDFWKQDHYGNRYAVKVPKYRPDPSDTLWHRIEYDEQGKPLRG